jgi:hypothetical protein
MDSLIMDVAVGIIFVFAVLAAMTSAVTEFIASRLGLRAKYLLNGMRTLLDGGEEAPAGDVAVAATTAPDPVDAADPAAASTVTTNRMLANALVANQGQRDVQPLTAVNPPTQALRKLPSYLPARTFARGVFATLVPDSNGATTLTDIRAAIDTMDDGVLKRSLLSLVVNADGEISRFRELIEHWYDDHMARVSGWYKKHASFIARIVGACLVLIFNVNAISIARSLYADEALRESIVTQAAASAECDEGVSPADCLKALRAEIQEAKTLGLPIGWSPDPACTVADDDCTFFEKYGLADPAGDGGYTDARVFAFVLLGYVVTSLALAPGSRFWFDLLGRLGSLRASGPKPPAAGSD